jgi:hypothetical protein
MKRVWMGRILTGLSGAFLLMDSGIKLVKAQVAVEGSESCAADGGDRAVLLTVIWAARSRRTCGWRNRRSDNVTPSGPADLGWTVFARLSAAVTLFEETA